MAGLNKVMVIGYLGRDPELKYTQAGQPVCRLNMGTTRVYTNKQTNEKVEEVEWHRITVWGKSAEHCNEYLKKGSQAYVEGRLRTSSYTDKDEIKRYSTEIVADTVQFLGGKNKGESNPQEEDPGPHHGGGSDDDIPF